MAGAGAQREPGLLHRPAVVALLQRPRAQVGVDAGERDPVTSLGRGGQGRTVGLIVTLTLTAAGLSWPVLHSAVLRNADTIASSALARSRKWAPSSVSIALAG